MVKVEIYEYIGDYGSGISYETEEEEKRYKYDKEWEYVGTWDLPASFIAKCLPAYYIE